VKKLFALLAVLCCLLSVCCTSPPPIAAPRAPDVTTVTAWRDFELVIHVDTDLLPVRSLIERSAENVRRLTHDRARLTVAFDLDFASLEGMRAHHDAAHSFLIGVWSTFEIVKTLDAGVKDGRLMAATVSMTDGSMSVFLILDRIDDERFENTVTHEFGHVIGLSDLAPRGAIMSGQSASGSPAIPDWTPADVEACRALRFCD
jgi:hypothetical protein